MEGLSPGSGSLKPRTYIRGERGRRKTGRQDWTQEGLVASATGPFVLLHVPESHPFRGERSQDRIFCYIFYTLISDFELFLATRISKEKEGRS